MVTEIGFPVEASQGNLSLSHLGNASENLDESGEE